MDPPGQPARAVDPSDYCFDQSRRSVSWWVVLQDGMLFACAASLAAVTPQWLALTAWSVFRPAGLSLVSAIVSCIAVTACGAIVLPRLPLSMHKGRRGKEVRKY